MIELMKDQQNGGAADAHILKADGTCLLCADPSPEGACTAKDNIELIEVEGMHFMPVFSMGSYYAVDGGGTLFVMPMKVKGEPDLDQLSEVDEGCVQDALRAIRAELGEREPQPG